MDRYQRVEKPREEAPISENEIRVTSQGRTRNYITYAMSLLQDKGSNEIVIKAMGRAINKTVMIAELIKRRIAGLHQNTAIESTDITDIWEPLEEGLLPLETTRHVSMITVTLSRKELDTSFPGYQPPIPADQVQPLAEFDDGEPLPRSRGGGRGGRGRGRGRGYSNRVVSYDGDEGWEGGRFIGRGRGRGRGRGYGGGYGGRDMQEEAGGYDDGVQAGFPPQGRGYSNGVVSYDGDEGWEGGRIIGRGRGRGRGRGYRGGYGGRDMQQEAGGYDDGVQAGFPPQGRGYSNGVVSYDGDEGWEGGRFIGRGRGRGRGRGYGGGYGGRDMQEEAGGYDDGVQAGFPPQGRGRGRGGRGRGRGRGRVSGGRGVGGGSSQTDA